MVSSQHPAASEVGRAILQAGGNAVDAAVATAFAIGVVEPYHSGIGGGSFILVRDAGSGEVVAIDAREKAPAAADRDMYRRGGEVVAGLSASGPLSVGVPGTVAGLSLALERYGTMTLAEVLAPSIEIADAGVPVDPFFHDVLSEKRELLLRFPATAAVYLEDGVRPFPEGTRLVQKDLAETYRRIAREGADAFYRGAIADAIADHMAATGGLITREDLADYTPVIREPIHGTYRGLDVYSMPPPSSGGIHLVQILNMLEGTDLSGADPLDTGYLRRLARAMSLAFADRARYLGDADFVDVPVERLISKEYARERLEETARGSGGEVPGADGAVRQGAGARGGGTSHLSVVDAAGNAVSLTQTINLWFGSGVMVPGTGIVLNDEMDDFSAASGVPNEFGLVGSEANAIAPGKRPLSSMCPTIILRDGRPFLVLGSRGGPRIITSVLQVAVNVIDLGMDLRRAIDAPRIHHQWRPDLLYVEASLPERVREGLEGAGYRWEVMEQGIGCVSVGGSAGRAATEGGGRSGSGAAVAVEAGGRHAAEEVGGERDDLLVDVEQVRVKAGAAAVPRHAEPDHRAGRVVEIPGKVLSPHRLLHLHDPSLPAAVHRNPLDDVDQRVVIVDGGGPLVVVDLVPDPHALRDPLDHALDQAGHPDLRLPAEHPDRTRHGGALGDRVRRIPRADLTDRQHERLPRIDLPVDELVEGVDDHGGAEDRVLAVVGTRRVAALADDLDLEDVRAGGERPLLQADRPGLQVGVGVESDDRLDPLHGVPADHVERAAGDDLLRRLEDEPDAAGEAVPEPVADDRHPGEDGDVEVVPAAVHDVGHPRGPGDVLLVVDADPVELAPHRDERSPLPAAHVGEEPGAVVPAGDADPLLLEELRDVGRGVVLLAAQLRVAVEVPPEGGEHLLQLAGKLADRFREVFVEHDDPFSQSGVGVSSFSSRCSESTTSFRLPVCLNTRRWRV
jgi:gamma-glutamyltranspeptidase/glutathione hydrolase